MEMFETIIGNEQISVIFLYDARYQQWSMYEKYYISLKYMVTEIKNTKGFSKSWNDSLIHHKGNHFISYKGFFRKDKKINT